MTSKRPSPAVPERLKGFVDTMANNNPFGSNRVERPSAMGVDVGGVHAKEFKRLEGLARQARMQTSGIGVVLWGTAGVGKSHMIGRFAKVADPACFVYLNNIQSSPDRIPFYVLKCVVSYLTGNQTGQLHQTSLFKLVHSAVQDALRQEKITRSSWPRAKLAFERYVDRIRARDPAAAVLIDQSVFEVIFCFYRSAETAQRTGKDDGLARLAAQWLSGDQLDGEKAARLGLAAGPQDEPIGLLDEQHVKQVFFALTQIAVSRLQPFILCFDQVDAARVAAVSELTRFLHELIDNVGNLLVITSGVRETLYQWLRSHVIAQGSWDRIAQHEILLTSITTDEGRQILEARIGDFLAPFRETEEIQQRVRSDGLFPLGKPWFDQRHAKLVEVRPRDIVSHARERWCEQQEGLKSEGVDAWLKNEWGRGNGGRIGDTPVDPEKAVDATISQKVLELKDRRLREEHTLPPDGDNLAGIVHALLSQCIEGCPYTLVEVRRPAPPKYGARPVYDLEVRERRPADGRDVWTKLLFVTTQSATSVARTLGRVVDDKAPPPDHLLLVTDQRQPLPKGAKGEERLKQLVQRGAYSFRHIELPFEQYATLDALQAVVGLAVSADLEVELPGRQALTLTEKDVVESHRRQKRYLADSLLRELLTEETPPLKGGDSSQKGDDTGDGHKHRLDEQDARMFIRAQLALSMGASTYELAHRYVRHLTITRPNQPTMYLHHCKAGLESVARQMDAEGLIKATPHDDGLFLLTK